MVLVPLVAGMVCTLFSFAMQIRDEDSDLGILLAVTALVFFSEAIVLMV